MPITRITTAPVHFALNGSESTFKKYFKIADRHTVVLLKTLFITVNTFKIRKN